MNNYDRPILLTENIKAGQLLLNMSKYYVAKTQNQHLERPFKIIWEGKTFCF